MLEEPQTRFEVWRFSALHLKRPEDIRGTLEGFGTCALSAMSAMSAIPCARFIF
jgi:hypothetical protein